MACWSRIRRLLLTGMSSCLGVLFLAGCATDAVTGKNVVNMYTVQDDVKLGQSAMASNLKELKKQGVKINQDPVKLAEIKQIVDRIVAVSDLPQLPYEVTLVHTNIVNAAAMPGGQMIVFEGLYNATNALVKDKDEMAAVLAHEIAHVNCRHSTERLTKLTGLATVAEVMAIIADHNDKSTLATGIRTGFALGTALYIPTYTRADEYEADRVGLFYMAKAGYDPRAAPRIWKRVSEERGNKDKASIFATHPSSGDRYKALEKLVPYAMEDYALAAGGYPRDYTPSENLPPLDWRKKP